MRLPGAYPTTCSLLPRRIRSVLSAGEEVGGCRQPPETGWASVATSWASQSCQSWLVRSQYGATAVGSAHADPPVSLMRACGRRR